MTTLVRGAWVLTMTGAEGDGAQADGAVAFSPDGAITAVGPWPRLRAGDPDAEVVGDGTGIVLPGLVNAHTHLTEGLITGMGETASLWEWFDRVVDPVARVITRAEVRVGARLRVAEMLLSGVTTVNDMPCHRNLGGLVSLGSADGLAELGVRGTVAFGAEDDYPQAPPAASFIAEQEALADRLADEPLLSFRAGVGTILGVTDELMSLTVAACRTNGWGVHTHLAEVREEVTAARSRHAGLSTIEHAAAVGLLDQPVIAGHCIWCSSNDVSLLAAHDVAVAHNPVANMILASGVCPLRVLRREGITIGIGTDGAASNDSQDMLGAIKTAALLQKVSALRADEITAPQVLRMGTLEGARALGLEEQVGSLEVGKHADLVLLAGSAELAAIHDPWQQVVYCATPRSVSDVWVNGRARVRAGELVDVSLADLASEAREHAGELVRRAGLVRESVMAGAVLGEERPG